MVKSPCCPSNISCTKVKIPSHTMGVMSTPKAGGTAFRIDLNKNSVGHATRIHGISRNDVFGYQLKTMRHSCVLSAWWWWSNVRSGEYRIIHLYVLGEVALCTVTNTTPPYLNENVPWQMKTNSRMDPTRETRVGPMVQFQPT